MMNEIKIPIVYVEKGPDERGNMHGQYDDIGLRDVVYSVQAATVGVDQECFVALIMKNGRLCPIQIVPVQEMGPYFIQDIYSAALAVEATAIIIAHDSPIRNIAPEEDMRIYTEVRDAGYKIGIPLLDFVVLTGGMVHGIYDAPMIPHRWKDLKAGGCELARQVASTNNEVFYLTSAYLPEETDLSTIEQTWCKDMSFTMWV